MDEIAGFLTSALPPCSIDTFSCSWYNLRPARYCMSRRLYAFYHSTITLVHSWLMFWTTGVIWFHCTKAMNNIYSKEYNSNQKMFTNCLLIKKPQWLNRGQLSDYQCRGGRISFADPFRVSVQTKKPACCAGLGFVFLPPASDSVWQVPKYKTRASPGLFCLSGW